MIFRKQKPTEDGHYWAVHEDCCLDKAGIVHFEFSSMDGRPMAFCIGGEADMIDLVTHWGDRIEKPSVEIEEDESSATSSEPGDIAPLMGLLSNSSDEELDCLEQYFERQRES